MLVRPVNLTSMIDVSEISDSRAQYLSYFGLMNRANMQCRVSWGVYLLCHGLYRCMLLDRNIQS